MQREITELTPDPTNPLISRVAFADGSAYSLPSATIQPLYEQQMAARRAQMTAQGPSYQKSWTAQDFSTPVQMPSNAPFAPQAPPTGAQMAAAQQQQATIPQRPVAQPVGPATQDLAELGALKQAGYKWTLQDEAEHRLHPEMTRAQLLAFRGQGGGQKAVTQADLQRAVAQSVPVPTATSTSITGKSPVSERELQGVTDAQVRAADANAHALEAEAVAKRTAATAQHYEMQNEAARQAHEVATREASWQDAWGKLQSQLDPTNEANHVDPQRWVKERGAFGAMLAVIGGALQTAGNIYSHNGGAGTALEKLIDRDIRAQEVDIQTRRGNAQNQLMKLSQDFGSLEAGKSALRIAERQALDTKIADFLAQKMAPADEQRIAAIRQQNQADIQAEAAKLKALYGGSISQTEQAQMMRPHAAIGAPRYSEQKIQAGLGGMRSEQRADIELGIKAGEAGGKTITPEQAAKLGEYSDVKDRVIDLAREYGLRYNPQTRQIERPEGWSNPVGTAMYGEGPSMRAEGRFATPQQHRIVANTEQIIPLYTHAQMGRVTEQDLEIARRNFYGGNPEQTPEALNAILKTVNNQLDKWGGAVTGKQRVNAGQGIRREQAINEDEPLEPKVK